MLRLSRTKTRRFPRQRACGKRHLAATTDLDMELGFVPKTLSRSAVINCATTLIPIYGELLTFGEGSNGMPFMTGNGAVVGLRLTAAGKTIIRVGYNLFEEVRLLL